MPDTEIDVKRETTPAVRQPSGRDVFQSFRNEIDRLFDRFWQGFGFPSLPRAFEGEPFWRGEGAFGMASPAVDFTEDDKAYHLTAELPGMTEKDIDVTMSADMLTISGQKRDQREQKDRNYHFSERRFGSFRRTLPLPQGIDRDKVEANFRNGVLAVTMPKTPDALQQHKKIEIKS
jgi:HSP20 family protein